MLLYTRFKKLLTLALPVVLFAMGSSALAQPSQVQKINGVSFVSGGVGDEAMTQLTAMETQFDLKLFLVGKSGTYLSDIGVAITDANDKGVLLTTSDGPVLLANLPSGTYSIKATKNGDMVVQLVNVTLGQLRTVYLRFPNE